ncbi:MAG TPA: helix-turn-helix transcriptional regulator [Solirubrobacterales bacterium]|nr:helix-turn-helix transcriptional regulator [Solirubrobacterales bacterium]
MAAHIRERRFELDLTQKKLAEQVKTSHSYISKLERGDHTPGPVLERILAVLDEELRIAIERREADEEREPRSPSSPESALA